MDVVSIGDTTFVIPFADLLPPLSEQEYADLKADIQERGIIVPIIVGKDHRVIDGQHRLRIAADLGLGLNDVPREWQLGLSDDAEHDLCIDLNTHRRQLDIQQRREAAQKLRAEGKSYRQIGEELGVSVMTARKDVQSQVYTPYTPEPVQNRTPAEPLTDLAHINEDVTEAEQALATLDSGRLPLPPPAKITGRDGKSYPASLPRITPTQEQREQRAEQRQQAQDEAEETQRVLMDADAEYNDGNLDKLNLLRELGPAVRTVRRFKEDEVIAAFERHPHMDHILTDIHQIRRWAASIERRCSVIVGGKSGQGVG